MAIDTQLVFSFDRKPGFGPPVLIRRTTPCGTRSHKGLFRCACGSEFESLLNNVSRGHTMSCGCMRMSAESRERMRVRSTKHGHFAGDKPTPTYKSWQAMIARCTNPKHPAYGSYAGRGITICAEWLSSFDAFLADMGERPMGRTLDRHDNNRGYSKENCRWATHKEQSRNCRNTVRYEYAGENMTAAEIHEQSCCQVPINTLRYRLSRGVPASMAIIVRVRPGST